MTEQNAKRYTPYARHYLQPAFLICATVLAIAASIMSMTIKKFGVILKKEPLPLKKPLDLLDEKALADYKVTARTLIENKEVVKSLGTKDYLQWNLEDANAAVDSTVRYCTLFITYYDLPDVVLHVPEECYMGSGYQRLAYESVTLKIKKSDAEENIPVRYIVFTSTGSNQWQSGTEFPVLYLFNVNGVYANSREEARMILNENLFGKYSYFSKIEWKFFNTRLGAAVYPSKEDAIAASQKLLKVILPILETDHWPITRKERHGKEKIE